jgi:hypothetical protein
MTNIKSPGQMAYEEDVRRHPNHDDGTSRPTWDELGDAHCAGTQTVVKDSWEKNPTPRDYSQPTAVTTIDITPASLKTAAGAAAVDAAMSDWQTAQANVANKTQHFLDQHGASILAFFRNDEMEAATEDTNELREVVEVMASKQDAFLRALAGRPAKR